MINKMLLSTMMAMSLLLPVNIQTYLSNHSDTQTAENESLSSAEFISGNLLGSLEDQWKDLTDKPVTPAVTHVAENDTTNEKIEETKETPQEMIENWTKNFPTYDGDSKQTQFIQRIAPAAVLIADQYGIYPSVMIAQAALESSWGQSDLATVYNNLMGTKGTWKGESITVRTREDVNGESVYINAGFSVYDSWGASLYRYGNLMRNGLNWDTEYYHGTWRENTDSYLEATDWLQGRYATDTSYANKLNQTIQSFNLEQYDAIESLDENLEDLLKELDLQYEETL
ncbi:MAG TPA: glycoside hydrolase family 73 protein [Atopostipes sp.]|nr:glycoside hydrolase family 73 protein [Atopostipes sp.]